MPSPTEPPGPGTAESRVHVIGAGLAGLAAAVRARQAGWAVTVHEAAGQAGGRARSFVDEKLGVLIDNGNHLLLSGNHAAMDYLETIGARDRLYEAPEAAIPFVDLITGDRWVLRPGPGRSPFWIFNPKRRVPGSTWRDHLSALRLGWARRRTVAEMFDPLQPIYRRFWEPFTVAVLNTAPDEAAARLLWPVLRETLGRGEAQARPCIARTGLSETFVDPALGWLATHGAEVRFNSRVRAIHCDRDGNAGDTARQATALDAGGERIALGPGDRVVLAVTAPVAADLLPGLDAPTDMRPIVNLHFRLDRPVDHGDGPPLLGIVGGTAQWLFFRPEILSVTISAATVEAGRDPDELAAECWTDIGRAVPALAGTPQPPVRVIREKRATFAQTPEQVARRPGTVTPVGNLVLAGDWIDTGLPATIEGAIRSGHRAASALGMPGGASPASAAQPKGRASA